MKSFFCLSILSAYFRSGLTRSNPHRWKSRVAEQGDHDRRLSEWPRELALSQHQDSRGQHTLKRGSRPISDEELYRCLTMGGKKHISPKLPTKPRACPRREKRSSKTTNIATLFQPKNRRSATYHSQESPYTVFSHETVVPAFPPDRDEVHVNDRHVPPSQRFFG